MKIAKLAILPLVLLLTSCVTALSADTRITLYKAEEWEASAEVVFSSDQVALAGGQVDQSVAQAAADMRAKGVEAEWKKQERSDGNIGYVIIASGQGLDTLNAAFFDGQATLYVDESSGQRQIVFRYYPGLQFAQQEAFTLVGGKFIFTNGTQVDTHTVTWVNPTGQMEAVLTEAPRYPWLPYALIGVGVALLAISGIGIAGTLLIRPRVVAASRPVGPIPVGPTPSQPIAQQSPALAPTPSPPGRFCAQCGARLPDEAAFCTNCGSKVN